MAKKDGISKARDAARTAQRNEYIQRLIQDEELRSNLAAAYAAARGAYGRASNGKPTAKAIFEDKKVQRELHDAAHALRQVSDSLRDSPKKARRKGGLGRALLLLSVGGVLAVALSEGLRSKVLDLLFGAEEEFDYSSTTMPAQEAPSSVGASAA
jgi:hypothetical protein